MKRQVTSIIITFLIGFVYYYVALPAINGHSTDFWIFLVILISVYLFISSLSNLSEAVVYLKKPQKLRGIKLLLIIPIIFIGIVLINFFNGPLFNSKAYANRIKIDNNKTFTEDVKEVDFTKLPLLDKSSSQKLGDRVMGQMKEFVSQYSVSNLYTQINYNDTIIRVTPLEYASVIKWFTNKDDGIKGYITVNSVNGEAKLIKLDKGMQYVPSALFSKDLNRKLRFDYPTVNFGKKSFEIDNEGNPYWIIPTIKYSGIELRAKVTGVIILDAVTGESKKYKDTEIPTWVDQAYSAELVIEQVDDWGTYSGGFINSVFGQKNVVNTTDGYNYLAMDNDIYMYTGITSIVSDESNLGFILTNMRTGETNFYEVPGAEEYSAKSSAEGAVQQMKYTSTFPLLINLNSKPTYLVSLKDDAGLVKMYAFIDVADYQHVVVTDASKGIEVAAQNYLGDAPIDINEDQLINKMILVNNISTAIINGNTYYYIVDDSGQKYKISINLSDYLPFIKNGDKIKVGYSEETEIINVKKVY